ncbi:MAG: leucyl aminopeptidase [Lachnospiraceae bacterium]|nr:leucyl aminopeptidase [Lachnospiraceae bacterium]
MKYKVLFQKENEEIRERYQLAMERIGVMEQEKTVKEPYSDYFHREASFVMLIKSIVQMVEEEHLSTYTLNELQSINRSLYEDLIGDNYEVSYTNPAYACEKLGKKYGKLLSFLTAELRSLIVYAYENRLYELTIYLELLIEVYNYFEREDEFTYKDVKRVIYAFMSDYCDILVEYRTRELLDTNLSYITDIIMESDLSDIRYLYKFGDYITENEIKTAEYMNSLSEKQVQAMADTFTEGYRLGFIANRLDLSKKSIVNIRYQIGFERMVRYAIQNFRKLGLEPTIYRAAYNAVNKRQHLKIGCHGTSPSRQYEFDHRFDIGIFYDKAFQVRQLKCLQESYEKYKEQGAAFAGPSLIEVFGEEIFIPEDKKEAIRLDKRQQKLYVDCTNKGALLSMEYLKLEETSFTIIAYPIPEIGKDYEAIFTETVKVNTLDSALYQKIQQKIIDTLDQGDYVRVLGAGKNHTDMKVKLYSLLDPAKETIFENCVADVNIPVGEVFTSPVLKGTEGVLHASKVYLNDLEYRELNLVFKDGVITEYTCGNFTEESKNKSFVKENLLFGHDSLPLGEFAIGTNTTAYMMGKKYDIAPRLPILIAEKTGPHFAIGDTCYKHSEETMTYNPDGKAIVARDNEVSLLRKTDLAKAYFNCHTDITLPYDELKAITVYCKDGTSIPIIENGRFVLEGTEELNKAFDEN